MRAFTAEEIRAYRMDGLGRVYESACCGLAELDGIQSIEHPIVAVVGAAWTSGRAYLTFVDNQAPRWPHGRALAAYITANRLGSVTMLPPSVNPGTKKKLRMWVWVPHQDRLKAFVAALDKASRTAAASDYS